MLLRFSAEDSRNGEQTTSTLDTHRKYVTAERIPSRATAPKYDDNFDAHCVPPYVTVPPFQGACFVFRSDKRTVRFAVV